MTEDQIIELAKTLLTAPILLGVVGGIISLLTSYWPGFREKYAALDPVQKAAGQFGLITAVVLAIALVSFTRLIAVVPPNLVGGLVLALSWLTAVWTNQSTFTASPPVASVVVIKAEQKKAELSDARAEVKEAAAVADTEPEKKEV